MKPCLRPFAGAVLSAVLSAVLCALSPVAFAQQATRAAPDAAGDAGRAKGINPRENLTKVDVIYKFDSLKNDTRLHTVAFKYDQALDARWGANVELPVVSFSAPGIDKTGLGDVQLRLRYVESVGALALLASGELVVPTASDDVLGTGRWQLNPVVGAVWSITPSVFVFGGYKHVFSIAGDSQRPDVDKSQPRALAAYVSPKGWWVLGDLKYTRDHRLKTRELDTEIETGMMLSPQVAVSVRVGTSSMDSTRQSTFGLNARYFF